MNATDNRIGSHYFHLEETMDDSAFAKLQESRFIATLKQAYAHSNFYRRLYDERHVELRELIGLCDIRSLPFTSPIDLMKGPKDFISSSNIVSIHCSGGTGQNPKTVFRTYSDYTQSSDIMSRLFYMNGFRRDDIVAILQPFGIWAIGALAFEGLKRIGAISLPLGIHMNIDNVIQLLREHEVSGMFIAPSNCLRLSEQINIRGMDPKKDLKIRRITLAGERVTGRHREIISNAFGAETFSLYGSEETDGLATECTYHSGLHFCADQFYLEILDPETDEPVSQGDLGESVITTLTKEGSPLIRYKTGDLVRLLGRSCECGRSLPLIEITGRSSEVLVLIEGTKVYPFQVDAVLDNLKVGVLNYQLVRDRVSEGVDALTLTVEVVRAERPAGLADKIASAMQALSVDFADAYAANLVKVKVQVVDPETISTTSRGKVVRLVDHLRTPSEQRN